MSLVVAHRGYSALFPENTMIAFTEAAELGAPMIEMDLHMTADGKIVVVHDHELGRTISGEGMIHETDWSVLADLEAGSWFSAEFSEEGVPLLEEVLGGIPAPVQLNLEIKHEGFEEPERLNQFLGLFLKIIRPHEARIVVSCFSLEILRALRAKHGGLRLAYLNDAPATTLELKKYETLGLYSLNLNHLEIDRAMVDAIHGHGMKVFAYTPNSAAAMTRLLDIGVDALITDELELGLQLIANH